MDDEEAAEPGRRADAWEPVRLRSYSSCQAYRLECLEITINRLPQFPHPACGDYNAYRIKGDSTEVQRVVLRLVSSAAHLSG